MLKIAWRPNYVLSLPPNHRFPMSKYELLPEQLLYEGTVSDDNFFAPEKATAEVIQRAHTKDYYYRLTNLLLDKHEIRKTGFPLTQELVEREVHIAQGTVQAAYYALKYGVAMNIAGGTHHAFTDRGEGFCLFNDIAVAAYDLLANTAIKKILVIDLDVHQGNGTAEIFQNENRVFTFSMHGAHNYPMHKEKSDLDIRLPDKIEDREYLAILDKNLKILLDRVEPDFIFYQSGVDILETDKLGRLAVTMSGCRQRDKMVLTLAHENNIPLTISMGGGYSVQIKHIIEAHANTYRLAQEIYF